MQKQPWSESRPNDAQQESVQDSAVICDVQATSEGA